MKEVIATKKTAWEVRDDIGYLTFTNTPENRMDSVFFKELHNITRK